MAENWRFVVSLAFTVTPATPAVSNVLINPSLIGSKNILITTNMASQNSSGDSLKRKHEDDDDYDVVWRRNTNSWTRCQWEPVAVSPTPLFVFQQEPQPLAVAKRPQVFLLTRNNLQECVKTATSQWSMTSPSGIVCIVHQLWPFCNTSCSFENLSCIKAKCFRLN